MDIYKYMYRYMYIYIHKHIDITHIHKHIHLQIQIQIHIQKYTYLQCSRCKHGACLAKKWGFPKIRGPQYSTLNSRILIIRTPKEGTPIFGKSQISPKNAPLLVQPVVLQVRLFLLDSSKD